MKKYTRGIIKTIDSCVGAGSLRCFPFLDEAIETVVVVIGVDGVGGSDVIGAVDDRRRSGVIGVLEDRRGC